MLKDWALALGKPVLLLSVIPDDDGKRAWPIRPLGQPPRMTFRRADVEAKRSELERGLASGEREPR